MKDKIEKIIKNLEEDIKQRENIIENNTEPLEKVGMLLHQHLGAIDGLRDVVRLLKESQKQEK